MKSLLAWLVTLVIADGLITRLLLIDGRSREGNPLLQPIVDEAGFLVLKVVGALVSAYILWDIYRRHPRLALVATAGFVAVYAGIVLWNLSLFIIG